MTEYHIDQSNLTEPLLQWYDGHARILPWRSNPVPYHVWVSEIMLQQTRVEAVKPYFDRFLTTLPDLASLAQASEETILKLWEGLGYYNRVRNRQKAAKIVMEDYGGNLPGDPQTLQKLPGIGEYTAGAVASIAFGKVIPCVDGNVLRVFARLLSSDADIMKPQVRKEFTQLIQGLIPLERPGDFNQALMELGATVCLPNGAPLCQDCPLQQICLGRQKGTMLDLPVKTGKKPRRIEERTVLILTSGRQIALRRRPEIGLLAGLWEFPSLEGHRSLEEIRRVLSDWDKHLASVSIQPIPPAKHIFTHVEWHMTGYFIECSKPTAGIREENHGGWQQDLIWMDAEKLERDIALPTAFRKLFQQKQEM